MYARKEGKDDVKEESSCACRSDWNKIRADFRMEEKKSKLITYQQSTHLSFQLSRQTQGVGIM